MTISSFCEIKYDKQLHSLNIFTDANYKVGRDCNMYINNAAEACKVINDIEYELKDYIEQCRMSEKEAKWLNGIKLKYINKSSKGETLYAFVIDNPQTYTNILKELRGYDTGLARQAVEEMQAYNSGVENDTLIRLASDTLESSELVKYKYYIVNVKIYKDKYPYIDEIAPYQAPIVPEFIDEDD